MSDARDLTEFKLVYDRAAELARDLPDAQFKTVASLLVIMGWLITADTAQSFIRLHRVVTLPATVLAVTLFVVFKALWIGSHYARTRTLHARLTALAKANHLSPETVDAFRPNLVIAATLFFINVLVCGAVAVCVALICG